MLEGAGPKGMRDLEAFAALLTARQSLWTTVSKRARPAMPAGPFLLAASPRGMLRLELANGRHRESRTPDRQLGEKILAHGQGTAERNPRSGWLGIRAGTARASGAPTARIGFPLGVIMVVR